MYVRMLRKSLYWSNKKKFLGSKQLKIRHHISAQNEGEHVLATAIFQNFPPSSVTNNVYAVVDLTLSQQINWRAQIELNQTIGCDWVRQSNSHKKLEQSNFDWVRLGSVAEVGIYQHIYMYIRSDANSPAFGRRLMFFRWHPLGGSCLLRIGLCWVPLKICRRLPLFVGRLAGMHSIKNDNRSGSWIVRYTWFFVVLAC